MNYKISVCGDKSVGKTSFINKLINNKFSINYTPSQSLSVNPLILNENLILNFWDISSYDSFKDIYLLKSDIILLIFDMTNIISYSSLIDWIKNINKIDPNIPIIVLANKSDSSFNELNKFDINIHLKYNLKLFCISCKTNYNIKNTLDYILNTISKS